MSVKDDLLKKINSNIQRKKELAKEVASEKTLATWISEFFSEIERLQQDEWKAIALSNLITKVRRIDYRAIVLYKDNTNEASQIEIRWSDVYLSKNNCESVTVMDASTAFFQKMIEKS